MNLELSKLRWFTRTVISLTELFAIIFIVWLTYSGTPLDPDKTQIISVLIGGLLLNFGATSKYFFSEIHPESNEHPAKDKNIETKRPLQPEGVDQEPDRNPAGHQQ